MNVQKSAHIARKAMFLAERLRGVYPMLDAETLDLAARFRKSRFDISLEGKRSLSDIEYAQVISCFKESAEHAAHLLRERLGEDRADKVRRIIEEHVEHYDGSGPGGKSLESILPEAYILNLACALQNMIEGNPNRHGHPDAGSIIESIIELAGSQYPPRMVSRSLRPVQVMLEEEDADKLRLAELGRISAGVFHDMNNYIAPLTMNLSYIIAFPEDTERVRRCAEESSQCVDRILAFRKEMLAFARGDEMPTLGDINLTMESAIALVAPRLRHVTIEKNYGIMSSSRYSEVGMKHVFANLLANAAEALPDEGKIIITTEHWSTYILISIADNGKGMDVSELYRIFEGDSTKHGGKGIGTRFSKYIVEKQGGSIEYESEKGVGTIVLVKLPFRTSEGYPGTTH